jgi:hypothetical protein
MKPIKNSMKGNFLKNYHKGRAHEETYIPLKTGFLKLEYGLNDSSGMLSLVSFVLEDNDKAMAVGRRLELLLSEDETGEVATFISENGISGLQWSGGRVFWGHTYDDDSPPSDGKSISLDNWIDECIGIMINLDADEIEERRRLDREG